MTEFADLFSKEVSKRREEFSERLDRSTEQNFNKPVSKMFDRIYQPTRNLEQENKEFSVVAADAGRNQMEFKNNTRLFVVQAAAVSSKSEKSKQMITGVLTPFSREDYTEFRSRISEKAELDAIIELLEDSTFEKETFVLIDGSLLTRMMIFPEKLDLSEYQTENLKLINKFHELLRISRNNESLHIAGISKDSGTNILYKHIIEEAVTSAFKNARDMSSPPKPMPSSLGNDKKEIIGALESVPESDEINQVKQTVSEFSRKYSDTLLVESLSSEEGITKPVYRSQAFQKFRNRIKRISSDPKSYTEEKYGSYLSEESSNPDTEKEFITEALSKLETYPGVATSYWRPEKNAQPIRVDLCTDEWGTEDRLMDMEESRFFEINETVRDLIQVLKQGYAGESMHNIWISQADNSASLSKKDIKNIYSPILSGELGINIRTYQRRRDKRD